MASNICVSPKCTVPFSPFIPGVPGLPSEPGTPGTPGMPGMPGGPVQLLWAQETWSQPRSNRNRGVETSPHCVFISSASGASYGVRTRGGLLPWWLPSVIYLSLHLSIYPSIHLPVSPSVHPSLQRIIHLSLYPSIQLPTYPFLQPFI